MMINKKVRVIRAAIVFAFIIVALVLSRLETSLAEEIFLGAVKAEITPPVKNPLSGYARLRGKPTVGIHDPIYARALALTKGEETFVFVSLDLCLIDQNLRRKILEKVNIARPLEENQLILFATHTHSGPGAIGGRFWESFIMGNFRKDVFEPLTDRIAGVIIETLDRKAPVTAEYGEMRIDPLIENRMDEKLNHPKKLKALRFKKKSGEITGWLVFMAAHPTLAPARELFFSADYPGFLTGEIERKHPGSVALFVNGAAADLRPHTGEFPNKWERTAHYGKRLAKKAETLSFKKADLEGYWQGVTKKVKLPPVKMRLIGFAYLPSWIGSFIFPTKTYFQVVRLGSFLFITFPGELASDVGDEVETYARKMFFTPFIVGYAHDYISYAISPRHYLRLEEYESQQSFYGKDMSLFYKYEVERLIKALLTEVEKRKLNKQEPVAIQNCKQYKISKIRLLRRGETS